MRAEPLNNSWCDYHHELIRLVNGGFSLREYARNGWILSRRLFRSHSRKLVGWRKRLGSAGSDRGGPLLSVGVEKNRLEHAQVRTMEKYLSRHLADDILGAYVHGSLGSGELVPYSDFDGLVVLRADVSRETARLENAAFHLCRAQRIMKAFDPLQHHGWFVLDEAMLDHFPEHYFPVALFDHAKALNIPRTVERLRVRVDTSRSKLISAFNHLAEAIDADTASRRFQTNTYFLKSTVSKLLLLPAAYVQARDGKGVFKRDSFELARRDFAEDDWRAIRRASQLRSEWSINVNPIAHKLMMRPAWSGRIIQRRLAPGLTERMHRFVSGSFPADVHNLVARMRQRLRAYA